VIPDEVLASPLKVVIALEEGPGSLSCEGVTIIVNLHGALIATVIGLLEMPQNIWGVPLPPDDWEDRAMAR
jgi:hypothetical protein